MAQQRKVPNLKDQPVDQLRNAQRGGAGAPVGEEGPEANATMRRVWSEPGGEAMNYRNAMVGAGTKADDHSELTAAETPEATRHLGDASLTPKASADTEDAIERATAVQGSSDGKH